jgi:predicted metalloprotease
MQLDELPQSENIEDRRGDDGGGFGMPGGAGGLGIGTIVVLGLVGWALGINPMLLIGGAEMVSRTSHQSQPARPHSVGTPKDQVGRDVAAILGSTEAVWKDVFAQSGSRYTAPTLVLFSGQTRSACGGAQSAMGPFYCPNDRKVYLDTSFFRDLERRFRGCDIGSSSCKFAQAYVIAHEVGHHVQNLLGILPRVQQQQRQMSKVDGNRLQVKVELQADCLAGVWAHHAEEKWVRAIEPGDVEAALRTAAAIGDDRLQRQATGTVVPDAFTHGSSEQRVHWFNAGLKGGSVSNCNTFSNATAQL